MNRRKFVNTMGLGLAATSLPTVLLANNGSDYNRDEEAPFPGHSFPDLPYSYNALEPAIDSMTMEIHYDRHHRGYFKKFMTAIKGSELENTPLTKIFSLMSSHNSSVRNTGGGFYNHTLFWNNLSPEKTKASPELLSAIDSSFGSFESFKEQFSKAAATRFGSGWAWLVLQRDGSLKVSSTPNQDNPLMDLADIQGVPLLALDVWEHAYYLKYQNKRTSYIEAFWSVINWKEVSKRFKEAG